MTAWTTARYFLNNAVISTLGELVTLSKSGQADVQVSAQFLQPEARARLANADYIVNDAMAVIRESDSPVWLSRGVTLTTESGRVFSVTQFESNGEGMLEITLARRT